MARKRGEKGEGDLLRLYIHLCSSNIGFFVRKEEKREKKKPGKK